MTTFIGSNAFGIKIDTQSLYLKIDSSDAFLIEK